MHKKFQRMSCKLGDSQDTAYENCTQAMHKRRLPSTEEDTPKKPDKARDRLSQCSCLVQIQDFAGGIGMVVSSQTLYHLLFAHWAQTRVWMPTDVYERVRTHVCALEQVKLPRDAHMLLAAHLPKLRSVKLGVTWRRCPLASLISWSGSQSADPCMLGCLPTHLRSLHLGHMYNAPLPALPGSLETLHLGYEFNQAIPTLPSSLTELHCGNSFNLPLPTLPSSLASLICSFHWDHPLPDLPTSLVSLDYSGSFALPDPLPASVTKMELSHRFNQPLPSLPPNLRKLWIFSEYMFALPCLPRSLRSLYFSQYNLALPPLPEGLERLNLSWNFDHPLTNLPSSLVYLSLDPNYKWDLPEPLPLGLKKLKSGVNSLPKTLPQSLRELDYYGTAALPMLPTQLKRLRVQAYRLPLPTLPNSLRSLICGPDYQHGFLFPVPTSLEIAVMPFLQDTPIVKKDFARFLTPINGSCP